MKIHTIPHLFLVLSLCWGRMFSSQAFLVRPHGQHPHHSNHKLHTHFASSSSDNNHHPNDPFDTQDLNRRIADASNPFSPVGPVTAQQQHQETLYIVAFDDAGVHSVEYPKGSGCNIILAFATFAACQEFAERLRAQHFFDPEPQAIRTETLYTFCEKMGVHWQMVPEGVDLIPPSQNVDLVGRHNRTMRQQKKRLEYIFAMAGDDMEEPGVVSEVAAAFG